MLCCNNHPIILCGSLAFVCSHKVPRIVIYPDGFYWIRNGGVVVFDSITPDGEEYTDRYGWVRKYKF